MKLHIKPAIFMIVCLFVIQIFAISIGDFLGILIGNMLSGILSLAFFVLLFKEIDTESKWFILIIVLIVLIPVMLTYITANELKYIETIPSRERPALYTEVMSRMSYYLFLSLLDVFLGLLAGAILGGIVMNSIKDAFLFPGLAVSLLLIVRLIDIFMNANNPEPSAFLDYLISISSLSIGVAIFFTSFHFMNLKRLIENIPTSRIRSLAMGLVEIYGEVVPAKGMLIKGPYSKKDCVYYKYEVQRVSNRNWSEDWKVINQGEGRTHFFLKDETGYVLVDTVQATIDKENLKAKFQSFAKETGFLKNRMLRYVEWRIDPGDRVYIMGTAAKNPFIEERTAKNNSAGIMIKKGSYESVYHIRSGPERDFLGELAFLWKLSMIVSFFLVLGGAALFVLTF